MKYILVWVLIIGTLFGAKVKALQWKEGQTFSEYLEAQNIPLDVLSDVSKDDQKFLSDISSRQSFYELKDENGTLLQALIPISEVMQIHLSKAKTANKYLFEIIPIVYETDEY
ncbi:MAG TPA: M23 family peptidase, partial [Epsilonproteobacteria bacterium]|nr:M23 family peptidase [Campylobacterota bacterium]